MPVYESHRRHIPDGLKPYDHWVMWVLDAKDRKRPVAPWLRGDLYPVKWGSDAPKRPETDFETAMTYYRNQEGYATPDGYDAGDAIPAPLLLHDPLDPPLMQVDFDDVRDPETGEVTDEVADIVDKLDAYTEISQSGEGLHLFARAELPGGLGKFIAPLVDAGDIELYDHGRCVGATWDQVEGTPEKIPERQDKIESIVKEYEDASQRERRIDKNQAKTPKPDGSGIQVTQPQTADSDGDRSVYFDIDIRKVADTGYFQMYGDGEAGPHPEHGPIHSKPENCTNFGIEGDAWYCFAHDSGGRALELAAVLCSETSVSCTDVPRNSATESWLRENPVTMLKTCLWLRDKGAVEEDARPPYAALLGVAEVEDLYIRDAEAGILGEANADIAETIFSSLSVDDV